MTAPSRLSPPRARWRTLVLGGLFLASVGAAFVMGALVHKYRVQIRGKLSALQSGGILATNLYTI
ncbi:MAG: hypothetical protein IT357_08005 [Gemmatimonadaceae bacterium]|nr:hypothetical protein [Gemmatimonadaceae bacterium]